MATEGVKVVPTIFALLYASDPMFSFHPQVNSQELMYFPCVCLEMGAD